MLPNLTQAWRRVWPLLGGKIGKSLVWDSGYSCLSLDRAGGPQFSHQYTEEAGV